MSLTLLDRPTNASPQTTLTLSQKATTYLSSQTSWLASLPYPLSLIISTESQEKWQIYENLFIASLRAGDDDNAYACLEEMIDRFGKANERVLAFRGLYQEATAKDEKELTAVLGFYEEVLKEDPTIFSVRKRRAALLRSLGKTNDAILALINVLDTTPTDAEAWAELGDLYQSQGMYEQAVFCLEEVLVVTANAWNMHAKLGELLYLSTAKQENSADQLKTLPDSMRRFCRSIELCDDYLRGYYGLKLTTTKLLEVLSSSSKKSQQSSADPATGDLAPPSLESVKKLNELATAKLAEIVRRGSLGKKGWDGYSEPELAAARQLLDKDTQKIQR